MEELKVYDIDANELAKYKFAVIKTDKGDMVAQLYPEETPQTVANFANLAKKLYIR